MDNERIAGIADHDQMTARARDNAGMFALHYKTLVESGMESEYAFMLTRDFHAIWYQRVFYPDLEPQLPE